MGFLGLKFGEPYNGSKPPVATTSMNNYIIEKGKVVYTDAMMCFGGDLTSNLEGASESQVRSALEGKLAELSVKAREKFVSECVLYFSMQKGETQNNKRMSDADYAAMASKRNTIDDKSSYNARANSPGKRAQELEEKEAGSKENVIGKFRNVELTENDLGKMMEFIHSRMPSSLRGEKASILEDVINYLNLI